jgi:hypothetical protein
VFGDTPTQEFLDGFGFTPVNPPNAALVVQTDAGETDVVVLELLSPIYDESTGSITYGAVILDEYTGEGLAHVAAQQLDDELPESFGAASLFIDDCAALSQCVVFDPTVLPFGQFEFLGPIPDGPYPTCFTAGQGCSPCTTTLNALASLCNQTYEDCNVFGSNSCQPA